MPGLSDLVLLAVLLGSAMTCRDWWRRWRAIGDVWSQVERPTVTWNPVAVVLGLSVIGLTLIAVISQTGTVTESLPTLRTIQWDCLFRVAFFCILLTLLTSLDLRRMADFGITLTDWPRQIWDGLELAVGSLLPVLVVLFATSTLREPDKQHVYLRMLSDASPGMIAWLVVGAVVIAPLLEELLFRVLLLGWLRQRMSSALAIGLSTAAFAIMHGLLDGIALVPLAVLLGWNYDRRRRFLTVVTAHAAFNLWNMVIMLCAE